MSTQELRSLLARGAVSFDTIRLSWSSWLDLAALRDASRGWLKHQTLGSVSEMGGAGQASDGHDTEGADANELWWRRQDNCWREEQRLSGGDQIVRVACMSQSTSYNSRRRALYTTARSPSFADMRSHILAGKSDCPDPNTVADLRAESPLLNGARFAEMCNFQPSGIENVAGRSAIGARAWRQSRPADEPIRPFFWPWITEWILAVDMERGTLLKSIALVGDRVAASFVAAGIDFDIKIPDEVFDLTVPLDTTVFYI